MEAYPEKYERLLKRGEKVLWHKKASPTISKKAIVASFFVFGLFAIFFIVLAVLYQSFSWVAPALFFVFGFIAINYHYYVLGNAYFVITNHRIIRDTKPHSKFQIFQTYYSSIHEIELKRYLEKDVIAYYTMSRSTTDQNGHRAVSFLPKIDDTQEVLHLLQENWMPRSPYQIFIDEFKAISKKHHLSFKGFSPSGAEKITIQGEIEDMPFQLSLSELHDIKTLSISITCPNAEGNYMSIRREKTMDGIGKFMGVQDLKINSQEFDDNFLLQSDNQHFLEKTLNKKTRKIMLNAAELLDWQVSLGVKRYENKAKKAYKKGTEDILDAHLIIENPIIAKKRDESNVTTLIYQCDNLMKDYAPIKSVANHCIINMEMMIKLAKRIKMYNN